MKARLIVFPVLGKRWTFNTLPLTMPSSSSGAAAGVPGATGVGFGTLRQLWQSLLTARRLRDRAEVLTHFVADKMHEKWVELEAAPEGSIRHRVYSVGQRLLARAEPSEIFLKTIPREATSVEILFPISVKSRLVRRRVRHLAISGTAFHRKFFYGSVALIPFSILLGVLPLPNFVLFWNIFRAHAHWQALQGGERLRLLVSDSLEVRKNNQQLMEEKLHPTMSSEGSHDKMSKDKKNSCAWQVLLPSKKLDKLASPFNCQFGGHKRCCNCCYLQRVPL
ncbi:hypothetical protein O6H91_Y473700 [Diphasiastrum complanatum]|nr:hypothetical protein O6H91_Y473700 [Diphasiastrum complanatum]